MASSTNWATQTADSIRDALAAAQGLISFAADRAGEYRRWEGKEPEVYKELLVTVLATTNRALDDCPGD